MSGTIAEPFDEQFGLDPSTLNLEAWGVDQVLEWAADVVRVSTPTLESLRSNVVSGAMLTSVVFDEAKPGSTSSSSALRSIIPNARDRGHVRDEWMAMQTLRKLQFDVHQHTEGGGFAPRLNALQRALLSSPEGVAEVQRQLSEASCRSTTTRGRGHDDAEVMAVRDEFGFADVTGNPQLLAKLTTNEPARLGGGDAGSDDGEFATTATWNSDDDDVSDGSSVHHEADGPHELPPHISCSSSSSSASSEATTPRFASDLGAADKKQTKTDALDALDDFDDVMDAAIAKAERLQLLSKVKEAAIEHRDRGLQNHTGDPDGLEQQETSAATFRLIREVEELRRDLAKTTTTTAADVDTFSPI